MNAAPSESAHAPVRQWIIPFMISALTWGTSFMFISMALRSFTPQQVGFGRVFVGATVLAGILIVQRHRPHFSWRQVAMIGVVAIGLSGAPFILIPAAQQHITSILASLLNATVPLWTALFVALVIPSEKVNRAQLIGLLLGAGGIAVLLGAWNIDDFPLWGAVLMLSATAFYGIGSTLSRVLLKTVKETPTALSAVQMVLSSLILAPFALASPAPAPETWEPGSVPAWALLALGVLGTSVVYVLFWRVVALAGATVAASVTYIVPIVATILGVVVLHEEVLWYEPVGAAIVLTGVWLASRKPRRTRVKPGVAAAVGVVEP